MRAKKFLAAPRHRLEVAGGAAGVLVLFLAIILQPTQGAVTGMWPLYVIGLLSLGGLVLSCAAAVGFAGHTRQQPQWWRSRSFAGFMAAFGAALLFLAVFGLFLIGLVFSTDSL